MAEAQWELLAATEGELEGLTSLGTAVKVAAMVTELLEALLGEAAGDRLMLLL